MTQRINYSDLAQSVDAMREMVRALVAGLVDDGFTDEQARTIVAGIFGSGTSKPKQ